ncbi:hypothetical protein, partial [Pseudomonas sp. HY7a-MNA-CIBAN-0227]
MLKPIVLKPNSNVHYLNKIIVITAITFLTGMVLTGCQTLPNMTAPNAAVNIMTNNPLTARMPAIDRQGYIAYVEEQGFGAAKISTLYS